MSTTLFAGGCNGLVQHLSIVHSTRSGAGLNAAYEQVGTLGWFQSNPYQVSAHFVADAEGGLTDCVPLERAAHQDITRNPVSVGIELTQATPHTAFSEGHYHATGLAFRRVND